MDTLFGIPAHPLIVHGAVVLLPLAALATLAVAAVPKLRRNYGAVVVVVAAVATVSVFLAQESGEPLEDRVDETPLVEEHTEHAEQVLPWAVGLTLVAAATVAAGSLRGRYPGLASGGATAVLVVLAAVAAIGATYTIIDVGHSGAKAVWDDLPAEADD
jgi:hypothetical protein